MKKTLILFSAFLMSSICHAGTTFELGTGVSSANVKVPGLYVKDIGAGPEIRTQVNWEIENTNFVADMFFQMRAASSVGSGVNNRFGMGTQYYFLREDDRFRPFVSAQLAYTTISVRDENVNDTSVVFSGSAMQYQFGTGVKYSFNTKFVAFIQAYFERTLVGSTVTDGASVRLASLGSVVGLGIRL